MSYLIKVNVRKSSVILFVIYLAIKYLNQPTKTLNLLNSQTKKQPLIKKALDHFVHRLKTI